jgi:hypothetical protein
VIAVVARADAHGLQRPAAAVGRAVVHAPRTDEERFAATTDGEHAAALLVALPPAELQSAVTQPALDHGRAGVVLVGAGDAVALLSQRDPAVLAVIDAADVGGALRTTCGVPTRIEIPVSAIAADDVPRMAMVRSALRVVMVSQKGAAYGPARSENLAAGAERVGSW